MVRAPVGASLFGGDGQDAGEYEFESHQSRRAAGAKLRVEASRPRCVTKRFLGQDPSPP